ncbi:MAG: PadR family transcriptional regulator [Planctomycetota bacterium]
MASPLDKIGAELRRGVIQVAALSLLRDKLYGYQLVKVLASFGLDTEEGTLYPLLRRLESQGLLRSQWDTAGARPRKYYVLSEEGRTLLSRLRQIWGEISDGVARILEHGSPVHAAEEEQ